MKNRLLFSTALVAVLSATNVYAQAWVGDPDKDFVINDEQTLSDKELHYYKTIQVGKDGTLNISNSNIKTTVKDAVNNDIVINGKLNLSNGSVLESGNDDDSMPNNSNMLIENATIDMQDSDLEANGNIIIKDTNLTSSNKVPESAGIWADGDITLEGGNTTLTNSYLASGGNITIQSGSINGTASSDILLSSDGKNKHKLDINGGDIILSGYSGIHSEGLEGQYNTLAADININGGDITVNDGGEITLTGNGNMNIANNANITMDYSDVTPDNAHDGGILHEGQSGDINISGGKINLTGEVAKIERGGYDGDWIYSATGETLMSEEEFYTKTGKYLDQANDEEIKAAGLNPDEIDKNQYHVSSGDINISGGEIALNDGARISTTYKNTGDINISGGKITLNNSNIENNAAQPLSKNAINVTGGHIVMNGTSQILGGAKPDDADPMQDPYIDINIRGGVIDMNDSANIALRSASGGSINITGGTVNVNGDNQIVDGVNLSNAVINIADGAKLSTLDYLGEDDSLSRSVINLGQNGSLNISGALDSNVDGNGFINFNNNGAKITGNVNMTEGGVMNVGLNNAVIEGDATFNSGSTLKLEIADSGNGSLTANSITGKEGSKLALNITKQMEINQSESFELLKGEVTDNFTKEISNNRYKVTSEDGKNFKVTYENSASDVVNDAGGTSSNASTAEAWDGMKDNTSVSATAQDVASKLNDLSQNDSKAYVEALTAVAPEVAPMVQKTQTETANQVFGAVSTRLTGGSVSAGGEGMSSGDNIFERAAMWIQGLFNKSKLDDTSKSYGFDADSSGVAMGAEKYVTEDTKIGLGYAYTNTDIDGFMRSTDVDTHTAFVYGEYKPSNWYVNGIASYGWSDYSESKNVSGIGVKADYDAETFGLQAMTGYDMQVKGFGLTPEVGLRYVHISQDGYTDSADQKVSGNDSDILTGVIGAKVSKTWTLENGMNIKPEARIAATYDLMNDDVNSVVTLANGSAYAVEGDSLDRFGMEFGTGVTAEVNDNVEFALGYEGKFREDYQDHTGLVNLKYKF